MTLEMQNFSAAADTAVVDAAAAAAAADKYAVTYQICSSRPCMRRCTF